MLIVFGVVLGVVDATARNEQPLEKLTMRDALIYGFAQALALVPGVSRSGGTISAGLLMGYRREAAARYSFLLAIPAVLVSGLFELRKIGDGRAGRLGADPAGDRHRLRRRLAVIVYFLRYISTHSFRPFVDLPDRARPGGPRAAGRRRHRHLSTPHGACPMTHT